MKPEPFELILRLPDGTEHLIGTVTLASDQPGRTPEVDPRGCPDSSLLAYGAHLTAALDRAHNQGGRRDG